MVRSFPKLKLTDFGENRKKEFRIIACMRCKFVSVPKIKLTRQTATFLVCAILLDEKEDDYRQFSFFLRKIR